MILKTCICTCHHSYISVFQHWNENGFLIMFITSCSGNSYNGKYLHSIWKNIMCLLSFLNKITLNMLIDEVSITTKSSAAMPLFKCDKQILIQCESIPLSGATDFRCKYISDISSNNLPVKCSPCMYNLDIRYMDRNEMMRSCLLTWFIRSIFAVSRHRVLHQGFYSLKHHLIGIGVPV